ncbi:MAG TPA: glycosyltransferase family 4 protein [Acidobacteriaceae bacterium]|nr:glycosyltransferase family 4 protein [Acidobacteriaceae bacterium]
MGSSKVIVSHPTGNANVTAVVNALYEDQLLEVFYTCVVWRPESALARLTPSALRLMLQRRARVQLPPKLVRTKPARELMRTLLIRAGKKHWVSGEASAFSIDAVYRSVDKMVARELVQHRDARAVYAYEDGALHQFSKAKQLGLRRLYDLPIGYWKVNREISLEESDLQPEWSGTLNGLMDSDVKLERKDREIADADEIFVASSFTKKTLESYPGWASGAAKPVHVITYGTPKPTVASRPLTTRTTPLKVIYVGSLGQRKGISYLAAAIRSLGPAVTLTLVGRKNGKSDALDRFCASHRWMDSLPHAQILEEMSRHDVLVFPSLFEGFGLVIGEALSQGVPVITTAHTGGPDIMRDGKDGFIVPIRDSQAIAERLLQLHDDRELLKQMSESALERAGTLDWQFYKQRTAALVRAAIERA